MNLKSNFIIIFLALFLAPKGKGAENIFLYKGTFSRSIAIEELYKFKKSKITSNKLKNLIKITNQNEKELHKFLSYKIEVPLITSSKLEYWFGVLVDKTYMYKFCD